MPDGLVAECWLVVEGDPSAYGQRGVRGMRVVAMRKSRPSELKAYQMAVLVKVSVPATAFTPLLSAQVEF